MSNKVLRHSMAGENLHREKFFRFSLFVPVCVFLLLCVILSGCEGGGRNLAPNEGNLIQEAEATPTPENSGQETQEDATDAQSDEQGASEDTAPAQDGDSETLENAAPAQDSEPEMPENAVSAQDGEPETQEAEPAQGDDPGTPEDAAPVQDSDPGTQETEPVQDAEPETQEVEPAQDADPETQEAQPVQDSEPETPEGEPAQDADSTDSNPFADRQKPVPSSGTDPSAVGTSADSDTSAESGKSTHVISLGSFGLVLVTVCLTVLLLGVFISRSLKEISQKMDEQRDRILSEINAVSKSVEKLDSLSKPPEGTSKTQPREEILNRNYTLKPEQPKKPEQQSNVHPQKRLDRFKAVSITEKTVYLTMDQNGEIIGEADNKNPGCYFLFPLMNNMSEDCRTGIIQENMLASGIIRHCFEVPKGRSNTGDYSVTVEQPAFAQKESYSFRLMRRGKLRITPRLL